MADIATEPLIPGDGEVPRGNRDAVEVHEEDMTRPSKFVWVLTICAAISGLLFGYDTGVISSTLVSIGSDLSSRPLSTLDKSVITSSTSFFALLASPLTGLLADNLGRKTVILAADVLFVFGALWQAWTSSVGGMVAGRSIVGAAVGSASFVVPLYIGELTPGPWRGRMVVVSSLFITGGQVVAYVIGWAFSTTVHGWRWMVGLGALPALVQFCILFVLPETPRWLVKAGQKEKARRVLRSVYTGSEGVDAERLVNDVLRRVEREILEEEDVVAERELGPVKQGWSGKVDKVRKKFAQLIGIGGNRRALIIACMLQAAQQLCGFNSLMYFSATIFSLVGFRSPILTSLSIATTNFVFTLVAFHYIDLIGRRRILLLSIPVMAAGLALCAVAFNFLHVPIESNEAISRSAGGKAWLIVILGAMVVYVSSYAIGLGNVPWQQSELFPLSVRSLGSSLATATNWGSNTFVGLTFLPMMQFFTPVGTFALYALVCVAAWVCVRKIYPETVGFGLEDVSEILRDGWGVEESVKRAMVRRRRERR